MTSEQRLATSDEALAFMQLLGPTVSYLEPKEPVDRPLSTTGKLVDPELIVVLGWMAARDAHLAKYVTEHRLLFPTSRILLIRYPFSHVFSNAKTRAGLAPAIPFLESMRASDVVDGPARVLLHVFSNGGTATASAIHSQMRKKGNGGEGGGLPRHVTIFDSCPGYFHWGPTHLAVSQSLPFWTSPLIHLGLAIAFVILKIFGNRPPPDVNAEAMLQPEDVASEIRRGYMYGDADQMIKWQDVEKHASVARQVGFHVAALELFKGGKHVTHAKVDKDRYWRVVKDVWHGT